MIAPLVCSLAGQEQMVRICAPSRASSLYQSQQAMEDYYCNYGVNPAYQGQLEEGGLVVSGTGPSGEIRIVEIPSHPFFLATLFLPQTRSTVDRPHPLIAGFAMAVEAQGQASE